MLFFLLKSIFIGSYTLIGLSLDLERGINHMLTRLCSICQKTVAPDSIYAFCDEHLRQFEKRQQERVSTSELDSRWGDTLDIWRERPVVLDKEVGDRESASPFIFSTEEKDWVVFIRFYYVSKAKILQEKQRTPRFNDTIAVNKLSGEIRCFVGLPKEVVLEDLNGVNPSPHHIELSSFWGKPDLGDINERWQQQFYNGEHRLDILKLVEAMESPVYGITNNANSFVFDSLYTSGFANYRVTHIGFLFSTFALAQSDQCKLCITSGVSGQTFAGERLRFLDTISTYDHYKQLLLFYKLENVTHSSSPIIWQGELAVGRQNFLGEIRYWSQPYKLCLFSLKGKEQGVSLEGSSVALSLEEIMHILKDLEVINHRRDVLMQYENERRL